jgi:hypothetical protein
LKRVARANARGVSRYCYCLVAAMATSATPGLAQTNSAALLDLEKYGLAIASSALPGAVQFEEAIQTIEQPMRAYKLTFETSSPALLKSPSGEGDQVAFLKNSGKVDLWQRKFCSLGLIPIMVRHGLDLVSGDLRDLKGETQSLAICAKEARATLALEAQRESGLDFRDGEARTWLDRSISPDGEFAVLAIKREGERYLMYRVGRDQVLESIPIRRAGARFIVLGDSRGAYYIVRTDGLGICDSRGCSRIARIDKSAPAYHESEVTARTVEGSLKLQSQPEFAIRRFEPVDDASKNAAASRNSVPMVEPAKRAELAKWLSESLPSLRTLSQVLKSVQSQKKDIRISSPERVRFCNEALAMPPADLGASGDLELDRAVSSLRSKSLEALRICASGNDLGAQILVAQAIDIGLRLDDRLKSLGLVAP